MIELLTAAVASLLAGFVDAVVGGGGLILVPALFSVYPNAAPATLFGTNKGAAIWGTAWATHQYAKPQRTWYRNRMGDSPRMELEGASL